MTKIFIISIVFGLLLSFVLFMNANTHAYDDLGGGICECNSETDCTDAVNDPACIEIRLVSNVNAADFLNNPDYFEDKIFDCQGHTIDGQGYGGTGIYLESKNGNTIKNCKFQNFYYGIMTYSSSGTILINNTANSNEYGIYISSGSGNSLINNTANSNYYGFYIESTSENNLTNNTASYNSKDCGGGCIDGYGFVLTSSNSNLLTENRANSNGVRGFYLQSSSDNNLIDNTAYSNDDGIYLSNSNNNNLTNNNASSNRYLGFYSGSSSGNIFINNIANLNRYSYEGYNYGKGFILQGSSNHILINNTANSNYEFGFEIYVSSSNNLTNNTANSNSKRGFYIYHSSSINNILENNNASSNTEYGFSLESSSSNILINNIAKSSYYGFYLSSSGNNLISNNNASLNSNYGFVLASSSNNNLTNNTIFSNTLYQIFVSSSSNNLIYNNIFNATNSTQKVAYVTSNSNFWNTTKTLQTNIIGGPYIGGNWYSNYTGSDLEGNDTIGEEIYTINAQNIDYLPLTINQNLPNPPSISFVNPTTASSSYPRSWISANVTASSAYLKNITIFLYNSTNSLVDYSTTNSSTNLFYNFTSLSTGTYYLNATAYDKASNSKEIYREFEVYSSSFEQQNITKNETLEMNETKDKEKPTSGTKTDDSKTGITDDKDKQGKDSETGSSTGEISTGNEENVLENLFVSESNPVISLIAFATSNPIVIAIPTIGLLAMLYLNKDKILPH